MLLLVWVVDLAVGSVTIPFSDVVTTLLGNGITDIHSSIILDWRLPKSITAIAVGAGLSGVGLVMQTLFRNPMADASVLGISSGAGLGVALFIMSSFTFQMAFFQTTGIILSGIIGALLVMLFIIFISYTLKNVLSVLIIGLMLNALSTSLISMLSIVAPAQQLQRYYFWGMGSLGHLSTLEIIIVSFSVLISLTLLVWFLKPLNAMVISESFTKSVGYSVEKINRKLLIVSSIIIGVLTAYVGPIAFIGLAVPHIAKLWLKTSDHFVLFPIVILLGSIALLGCDIMSQLPFREQVIPINAITSLLGAPLVIYLILKRNKLKY